MGQTIPSMSFLPQNLKLIETLENIMSSNYLLTLSLSTTIEPYLSWNVKYVNKILIKGIQTLVLLQD